MSHHQQHHQQTNGASLEDSHANFFSLTDVCGIKWCIFSEKKESSTEFECEDAVLESYGRCLEAEVLGVWRSVQPSSPAPYNYDPGPPLGAAEAESKVPKRKQKELWIFWYGDKPEDVFKRILHPSLKVVSSGTWEDGGLPYEARIHLFKALNNLIERSLQRKDFVRLGKCSVCASLDVRQHPAVRRLSLHHLSLARSNPLRVILAPYGLAATLTGVAHKASDIRVSRQLQKWHLFYLLDKNKYYCLDNAGELVTMPPAVEVSIAGVKLIYPTSYVLVTDIDHHPLYDHHPHSIRTFPSNHPLLHHDSTFAARLIQDTWIDGIRPPSNRPAPTGGAQSVTDFLSHWDFTHPARLIKKKCRSRSKEKSGRIHRLFNPKIPFHARMEPIEDLGWILDQAEMCNGHGRSGNNIHHNSVRQPGSVKDVHAASPITANTSKKTPGTVYDMSPAPPSTGNNGPSTPNESSHEGKQPRTPLPTYPGIPSPFIAAAPVKTEPETTTNSSALPASANDSQTTTSRLSSTVLNSNNSGNNKTAESSSSGVSTHSSLKRPALPIKDYEDDLCHEERLSDNIYDYRSMTAWLNHPVKKCRIAESVKPTAQTTQKSNFEDSYETNQDGVNISNGITSEPFHQVDENGDPFDFSDDKNKLQSQNDEDKKNWLTSDGLKPSINDLDNLFDDSSDETEPSGINPTPPNSNKSTKDDDGLDLQTSGGTSVKFAKASSKIDPTGNLPLDQLAKMFPTPPSHEHNPIASPAEDNLEIKTETPGSPWVPNSQNSGGLSELNEVGEFDLTSTKFGPLKKLYSDELPPLAVPPECIYKPSNKRLNRQHQQPQHQHQSQQFRGDASQSSNAGPLTPSSGTSSQQGVKPGMSPISPPSLTSSPASSNFKKQAESSDHKACSILADSLVLNLILSETLLNIFRDHNFDSCTMCVCSNDGNIKGRDASLYLKPDFSSDEDINCTCGFSAIINRRFAYQSGLFYEDESEVTSINEDLYYRKKPSLLMLLNEYNVVVVPAAFNNNNNNTSATATSNNGGISGSGNSNAASIVDSVPTSLLELISKQCSFHPSCSFDTIVKYSEQYLKSSSAQNQHSISMVELMDGNEVIFLALDQLDESQKETCLHKWTLIQAEGPYCSEDIIRVMKSIQPILNETLHVRSKFHLMAGPSTKGNTDDQCEPLPIPTVTVGYEKDFLSISPLALHFWEGLSLEPFAQPRDVAYIVVAPDNELVLNSVKEFFRNLSSIYEMCRLGKHVPITHRLKDGVLKVGRSAAVKLADSDVEEWFRLIGDSHIAALLKLYAQVCRHFLLPHLNTIPFDRSLLKPEKKPECTEKTQGAMAPPSSCVPGMNESGNGTTLIPGTKPPQSSGELPLESESREGKENVPETASSDDTEGSGGEAPAIVIYMVDPFTLGSENNLETTRLCALGLLRCFNQLVPLFNETLKHNIYLQLVSMDNILELAQSKNLFIIKKSVKSLTGFGPASNSEKYLKSHEEKLRLVRHLRCPTFVLASPLNSSEADSSFGSAAAEISTVLFCNYCLSEDQHWLLASCSDDRGELLKTVVINIEIPNKTRRKKASARRVGLRKLMDWILGVMAMNLTPWRLVIGRVGRIGHGELRGWSVLLSRAALKKASKQLREMCSWTSDVPSILSACLVSIEPDSHLRVMADQFTPDERFGQTASKCQLSTPRDVTCTHILVFPTSATAQSTQEAFRDHQDGMGLNPNEFEFDLPNLEDINSGDDGGMDINFGDLFEESYDQALSPNSPNKRNSSSQPSSPSGGKGVGDTFRYGQEEPGERIEILQQPLALGYLVSTAKTGTMPRWFWASCPHLENVCPVFLKSALHINVTSVLSGVDDGLTPQTAAAGRVHSLDSTYTTDVLRYVLEGYNALSWLSLDSVTHDRQSCLPIHVQVLARMYGALASLL
ncbi:MED13 [Lepeophtheirus salmonis]|uniref:Mediator of RNA polymerase II transcription subunit 13 n=1 Tax=Lepeophtheirus salmonis TaxID=72036 RepID=A0A7R8CIT0_LEPSM|nr:MED13 [Lepeophtheirus salmonis]CAF2829501.1 MED13 [Lepeophtheirus salmonis]